MIFKCSECGEPYDNKVKFCQLCKGKVNEVKEKKNEHDDKTEEKKKYSNHTASSTSEHSFLLGILVDVSLSMIKSISNRNDTVKNRFEGFRASLRKLIDKANEIYKEEHSDNIISPMKVFAIGFGFGNPLSFILGDNYKIKVRDLFQLPDSNEDTISINNLIDNREIYENHIEKLVRKMGGETPMGEAFTITEKRVLYELKNGTYNTNPVIFILSDGVPTDASYEDIIKIAERIKEKGVTIISCYVTDKNIVKSKYLFNKVDETWEEGAKLMFKCASVPPKDSAFYKYFFELGWGTSNNSGKLFAQVNETEFLEEFLEAAISQLQHF